MKKLSVIFSILIVTFIIVNMLFLVSCGTDDNDREPVVPDVETEIKVPEEETDVLCDQCGRKMVIKTGKFGKFLACPGYPECKNTKPMPEDEIKQPCPKCGSKLVKRNSKKTGKAFYGCTNYPQCDFASPGLPTGDVCAECGSYIITGRGRKYCMNSACPSRAKKSSKKDK